MGCAPVVLSWTVTTSATPSGSVADRFKVTFVLFQPAALGAGTMPIEVAGGEVSGGAAVSGSKIRRLTYAVAIDIAGLRDLAPVWSLIDAMYWDWPNAPSTSCVAKTVWDAESIA